MILTILICCFLGLGALQPSCAAPRSNENNIVEVEYKERKNATIGTSEMFLTNSDIQSYDFLVFLVQGIYDLGGENRNISFGVFDDYTYEAMDFSGSVSVPYIYPFNNGWIDSSQTLSVRRMTLVKDYVSSGVNSNGNYYNFTYSLNLYGYNMVDTRLAVDFEVVSYNSAYVVPFIVITSVVVNINGLIGDFYVYGELNTNNSNAYHPLWDTFGVAYSNRMNYSYDYNEAYSRGYDAGLSDGYNEGREYEQSIMEDRMQTIFNNGYNTGYTDGATYGANHPNQSLLDDEYNTGYQTGYANGLSDGQSNSGVAQTIFAGCVEVGLLPVNVFLKMFEYEVFGINIAGFVSALMTIAIVIIIIRMVTGGKNDK